MLSPLNTTFSEMFPCPREYDENFCLNGAQCSAVKITESFTYLCECPNGFVGHRCEFKQPDHSYSFRAGAFQGIFGPTVFLLIFLLVLLFVIFYGKNKGFCSFTFKKPVKGQGQNENNGGDSQEKRFIEDSAC